MNCPNTIFNIFLIQICLQICKILIYQIVNKMILSFFEKEFHSTEKFLGIDLKKGFIMISGRIHNNLLVLFTYYIIIMVLEIFKIAKQVFPLYLLRWWTINFHNENQRQQYLVWGCGTLGSFSKEEVLIGFLQAISIVFNMDLILKYNMNIV